MPSQVSKVSQSCCRPDATLWCTEKLIAIDFGYFSSDDVSMFDDNSSTYESKIFISSFSSIEATSAKHNVHPPENLFLDVIVGNYDKIRPTNLDSSVSSHPKEEEQPMAWNGGRGAEQILVNDNLSIRENNITTLECSLTQDHQGNGGG